MTSSRLVPDSPWSTRSHPPSQKSLASSVRASSGNKQLIDLRRAYWWLCRPLSHPRARIPLIHRGTMPDQSAPPKRAILPKVRVLKWGLTRQTRAQTPDIPMTRNPATMRDPPIRGFILQPNRTSSFLGRIYRRSALYHRVRYRLRKKVHRRPSGHRMVR